MPIARIVRQCFIFKLDVERKCSSRQRLDATIPIIKDLGQVADMFMIDVMVPAAPDKFSYLSNKTGEPTRSRLT